jgi:hypothetical protein
MAMRQRSIGYGLLCLAVWSCFGQPRASADVMSVKVSSGFGFSQTDFAPGLNVGGNDPLTFNKFNPGSGGIPADAILEKVDVAFDWGFRSQLSARFPFNSNPASSISINSFGGITVGQPDVSIGTGSNPSQFLFPTQTFQNTASFTSATPGSFTTLPVSTYFHSLPPGYVVPPADQPLNLQNPGSPLSTSYTAISPDFTKFLGAGVVTFDVVAKAGYNVPNTSGNATGVSLTYAFPEMTLTYTYSTKPIPEPSTLALLGLGAGGLWLARRHRRRRAAL